jgi:hypothetical protein
LIAHPDWLVGVDQAAVEVTGNRAAIQSYWFRHPGVAAGLDAGCWVLACLQVGLDSGGPFTNIGAELATASPGVIISGSDNERHEANQFFLSADIGPFSVVAGRCVWGDDEYVRDGHAQGTTVGLAIPTPDGAFPRIGGGFVHTWSFG